MARFPKSGLLPLLESAQQFAEAQPALAGFLGRASRDPFLERVREGVFYLAATVVDRIRSFEADGQRALSEVVAPALMRPFPAATIVEFAPGEGQTVPAGAEVQTRGEVPYRFRVVSDVELGPYRVHNARIAPMSSGEEALHFDITSSGVPLDQALRDSIRLYIDAPRESALLLVSHILEHTERAEVRVKGAKGQRPRTLQVAGGYGTEENQALAPEVDGPPTGAQFLREYFLRPEKFCFVELKGLFRAVLGSGAHEATVSIRFDAPLPARVSLPADGVRAHCTPAVNLFRASAEPRVAGPGTSSFPVRVAGLPRTQSSVYAILDARATPTDAGAQAQGSILIPPLRRFGAGAISGAFPYAYSIRLETSRGETYPVLTLTSPRGTDPLLRPHVISLNLLATNGACLVRPGELSEPGTGMPSGVRVRNLLSASPFVPAAAGAELALHAFVRSAAPSGDPLFSLKSLLFSLIPSQGLDPAWVRANQARVRALEGMEVVPAIDKGGARRGYRASFAIDETPFQGLGDVALFVRLLQKALDTQTTVNRFYQCEAKCRKGGARIRWPREAKP